MLQIRRSASEHRTVDQGGNILLLNRCILKQLVDPRVDRDDRVKDTRMKIGIQLDQDLRLGHRVRPG